MPITGRGDYIIGMERRKLYNVCIREPMVSMDNMMLLTELKEDREQKDLRYCKGRTHGPFYPQRESQRARNI